jgi:perosamine synthetase
LGKIEFIIEQKRRIAHFYNRKFEGFPDLKLPIEKPYAKNVYWMYHLILQGRLKDKRDFITKGLSTVGIETREGFIPYNMQTIFQEKGLVKYDDCSVANSVAYNSFYLPSASDLTTEQLEYISENLINVISSLV